VVTDFAAQTGGYGLTSHIQHKLDDFLAEQNNTEFKSLILSLYSADIADYITISNRDARKEIIEILGDDLFGDILVNIDNHVRNSVIEQIVVDKTSQLIHEMDIEDAVYIIENLDKETQKNILSTLPDTTSNQINERLAYPENSAGRIMHPSKIAVMDYWTVSQTIDYLRKNKSSDEIFYDIFVLDLKHKPVGSVNISKLISSPAHQIIRGITDHELITVNAQLDLGEVAFIFKQYDIKTAPVVNNFGRIIGTISVNDIIEVAVEETEEDLFKLGGISQTDLHFSFIDSAKKRLPWLVVNMMTAFISSHVISHFSDEIEKMVILASIMPMVASMGGNAGTQTMTIVVRAIALKDALTNDTPRIIRKEIMTSLTSSFFISILAGVAIYLLYRDYEVSLIFAAAIVTNFFTAGLMGSSIPIILNKIKVDPAVCSGIFLTAVTDSFGFLSFLILAKIFLLS